jgi:hypothetical protein
MQLSEKSFSVDFKHFELILIGVELQECTERYIGFL